MTFYKTYKTLSKIAIAAACAATLTSCMNRDQHITEDGATFYVDSIKPTFAPNKVSPNGDVNQKFINMKACLKDNAQKSIIMTIPFAVVADSVEIRRDTDRDGCITWQEMFQFNPTSHERQIAMTRTFVAKAGHYGSVVANIAYNPWKDDLQYLKLGLKSQSAQKAKIVYSAGKITTQVDPFTAADSTTQVDLQAVMTGELVPLDIANLRFDFLKRDFEAYEISPTLNLTIAHQYRLNFVVNAVKDTLDHGPTLEPVNQGNFRFNFILLREGYDPSKKSSTQDVLKYVIGGVSFDTKGVVGRFRKDITLKFDDISALANRMTGILTVESLDQPDTFATTTFEGMVTPVAGAGTQLLDLIPSEVDGKTLWSIYEDKRKSTFKLDALQLLADHSGFQAVKTAAPSLSPDPRSKYDFAPIFKSKSLPASTDVQFAEAVCYQYFIGMTGSVGDSAYNQCLADAANSKSTSKMLGVSIRDFVAKVNNNVPNQQRIPQVDTITISSGLDFTDKSNNEEGATYKKDRSIYGGLGAELGLANIIGGLSKATQAIPIVGSVMKVISGFGLSAAMGAKMSWNKDWYYSSGIVENQTQSSEIQTAHSQVITSEAFTFNLKVTTRTCLLLVPSAEMVKLTKDLIAPDGKYLCSNDLQTGTREETYYFITQTNGTANSPMSDSMSTLDNPIRMFMRGPKTYDMFTLFMTQKGYNINLRKISVEETAATLGSDLHNMMDMGRLVTQEFPGMLTADQPKAPVLPSSGISTNKTGPDQPCKPTIFNKHKCDAVGK